MRVFLEDYDAGKAAGRYVEASLPVAAVRGSAASTSRSARTCCSSTAPSSTRRSTARRSARCAASPREVRDLPAARAGRLALAVRRGLRRGSARGRRGGRDGAGALRVPARRERDAARCAGAQRLLERGNGGSPSSADPPELAAAYAHCERVAREHYENFPVASRLLPAAMRPHVAAVYAFARAADDFADEGTLAPAERYRLLDDWRARLHAPPPPPVEQRSVRPRLRRRRRRPGACASSTSSCSTIC